MTWHTECADILPSNFVPMTIHALLDLSPTVQEKKISISHFIEIPGNSKVIAVKVKDKKQTCHFCYRMGHTLSHCHHRHTTYYKNYIHESCQGPECPRQSASLPRDKATNSMKTITNCLSWRKPPFWSWMVWRLQGSQAANPWHQIQTWIWAHLLSGNGTLGGCLFDCVIRRSITCGI